MAGRTINVIEGVSIKTARWALKSKFEAYGAIEAVHMGNREDPVNHPPWVRFATASGAQKCLDALARGDIEDLGLTIRGAWRSDDDKPPTTDFTTRTDLDLTARDIYKMDLESRRRKKEKKEKKKKKDEGSRSASEPGVVPTKNGQASEGVAKAENAENEQPTQKRQTKWEDDHMKNMQEVVLAMNEFYNENPSFTPRGSGTLEQRRAQRDAEKTEREERRARGESVSSSPSARSCHTPVRSRSRGKGKGKGDRRGKGKDSGKDGRDERAPKFGDSHGRRDDRGHDDVRRDERLQKRGDSRGRRDERGYDDRRGRRDDWGHDDRGHDDRRGRRDYDGRDRGYDDRRNRYGGSDRVSIATDKYIRGK